MPHKTYPVLDKYTYDRPHQTDYRYHENLFDESENRIAPRLLYRRGEPLVAADELPLVLSDAPLPKNSFAIWAFGRHELSLEGCTGFGVEYDCALPQAAGAAVLRVTLYGPAEEDTFLSVCELREGRHTVLFDTAALPFAAQVCRVKMDVVSLVNAQRLYVRIESAWTMHALDTLCRLPGQTPFYTVENGTLCQCPQGLALRFEAGAALYSPLFPDSSDTTCNMLMPRRNTIFLVLANDSPLTQLTVAYRTTLHDEWCEKTLPIRPFSPMTAYYCNLSDTPCCEGRLRQFALRLGPAQGTLTIGRYTFEEEKPLRQLAGQVCACTADENSIHIRGTLRAPAAGTLLLYQTDPSDGEEGPEGKELIATLPAAKEFAFGPLALMHRGITRLCAQFLLLLRTPQGQLCMVDERFGVQNVADFYDDPYAFSVPDVTFDCLAYGAAGDAVADDTAAIQAAIDAAAAAGGGRVVLAGDDSFYGRRYIVTNLLLRSRVDLVIEKGAVLWQSQQPMDYLYRPTYGHDGVIEGINWTHCLHICNLPILQAHNCEYVRVSGGGAIRSMDTGSEEGVDMPGYSCGCPDRIHQISIGFFNVEHVNLADIEIVRANNYHISLYHCAYLSVTGVRMHQVKCVSGDGIGLGKGSHHVLIAGVSFQSNDDAVTLTSCYHDPRGVLWWASVHDGSCGSRHVRIEHCYLNSGGGKAIAFLPWGTTQRYAQLAQIEDIFVTDCHLSCVNPVGAWADNPYAGRMPFDNAETDDYSPVCGVRILHNLYQGNCAVWPLQMTDLITDCGLHSAGQFLNGDFSAGGLANWTLRGKAEMEGAPGRERALLAQGSLCQGLYLEAGEYVLHARIDAPQGAVLLAENAEDAAAAPLRLAVQGEGEFALPVRVAASGMWYLGVECAGAPVRLLGCRLDSRVDRVAVEAAHRAQLRGEVERHFYWEDGLQILHNETDGKVFLQAPAPLGSRFVLRGREQLADCELEVAFRVLAWHREQGANSYGFEVRRQPDGSAYRLIFCESERRLKVQYLAADGAAQDLYVRDNFFFTSDDFHIFRLRAQGDALTFWVDNARYAAVRDARLAAGGAAVFCQDATVLLRGLALRWLGGDAPQQP